MIDFQIKNTKDGGDIVFKGSDVRLTSGWKTMLYLGLFGGNVEQSTPTDRSNEELANDFWANELLFGETPNKQYNSRTERVLVNTEIEEGTEARIEEAIKADLAFMEGLVNLTINVTVLGYQEIQVNIGVQEPDNLEEKEFQFIWDSMKEELRGLGVETEEVNYQDYQFPTTTTNRATDVNKFIFLASSDDTTGDEVIGFNTGEYDVADIETVNVDSFDLYLNGTIQTGTFELKSGDTLRIDFTRVNVNEESRINLVP